MRRTIRTILRLATVAILCAGGRVHAADVAWPDQDPGLPPAPRYFPRTDGDGAEVAAAIVRRRVADCALRRVPVPTNAPDDPSYVGSSYGLGKPSYYGFTPPLGIDDPFGRPLRYCP